MGNNIENIRWIKTVIMNKWPTVLKDNGADLNSNGKIEGTEQFQDFNKNGVVGDEEDFQTYLELNAQAIAKQIEFVDLGAKLSTDNPIHSYLLNKSPDKIREIYKTVTAVMTELGGTLSSAKLLTALNKYPALESEYKTAVIEAIAYEYDTPAGPLILDMAKVLYNQAAQLLRDKKYTDSQQSISNGLVYVNILEIIENKNQDSVKPTEVKKIEGDFYLLSAKTYSAQTKNAEALADIDKALAAYTENNDLANAYLKRVDIYIEQKDLEKASQDCEKALSLATENDIKLQAYYRDGVINYKSAIALFNTAVDYHNNKKYLAALAMYDQAEAAFLKAIEYFKSAGEDAGLKADADNMIQSIRKILDNDLKANRNSAKEKSGN